MERIGELCRRYHVIVLADEIHCDLTSPGCDYIPFASISESCRDSSITCISATKAFNMAGLQTAAVVIPDERIRNIMLRGLNADEIAEPNSFAVDSVAAAFGEGEEWLDAVSYTHLDVYKRQGTRYGGADGEYRQDGWD